MAALDGTAHAYLFNRGSPITLACCPLSYLFQFVIAWAHTHCTYDMLTLKFNFELAQIMYSWGSTKSKPGGTSVQLAYIGACVCLQEWIGRKGYSSPHRSLSSPGLEAYIHSLWCLCLSDCCCCQGCWCCWCQCVWSVSCLQPFSVYSSLCPYGRFGYWSCSWVNRQHEEAQRGLYYMVVG